MSIPQNRVKAEDLETSLRPHLDYMFRLAFRFTCKETDAEDLVHDVLVKLYSKRSNLAEIENLRSWLAKVLYRTFIDQQRKSWRSPLRLLKQQFVDNDDYDVLDTIACDAPGPDMALEQKITRKDLQEAVAQLNPEQRSVCVLHDVEGYTLVELEKILDIPLGTLKSRLHRARAQLRKILASGT